MKPVTGLGPVRSDGRHTWLGEVPDGWDIKRLKYISSINDEALSETTDPDYELLYVDIGSVDATEGIQKKEPMIFENAPSRARRIARDGDTIVSTVRTYLRAVAPVDQPEENLVVSTGFAVVRPRGVEPKFLAYCLRSSYFIETVVSRSVGVSYPATNPTDISCIEIPLPSIDEQQAIARFLDAKTAKIDTLLAKKRHLVDKLREKRSALIARTVTRGLPPEAAKAAGLEANPDMKDSGVEWLIQLPTHWRVMPLKRIVEIPITDGPHETPEFVDDGIPFVSAEAVRGGRVHLASMRGYISEKDHKRYAKKYLPARRDIYIVKSGSTTGKVAIVDFDGEFNVWSPLAAIRCDLTKSYPEFIFYALGSDYFQGLIQVSWSFGTQPNIGMGVLGDLSVVLPPIAEQVKIANFLATETRRLDVLIEKAESVIDRLTEYRQALITSAVTGKIDVRNVSNINGASPHAATALS